MKKEEEEEGYQKKVEGGTKLKDPDIEENYTFKTTFIIPKGNRVGDSLEFRSDNGIVTIESINLISEAGKKVGELAKTKEAFDKTKEDFTGVKEINIDKEDIKTINSKLEEDVKIELEYRLNKYAIERYKIAGEDRESSIIKQGMRAHIDGERINSTKNNQAKIVEKAESTLVKITKIFYDDQDEYNHNSKPQGHESLYVDEYKNICAKLDNELVPTYNFVIGGEYKLAEYLKSEDESQANLIVKLKELINESLKDSEELKEQIASEEAVLDEFKSKGLTGPEFITIKEYIENNGEYYGHVNNEGVIVTDNSTNINVAGGSEDLSDNINKYFGTSKKLANARFIVTDLDTGVEKELPLTDENGKTFIYLDDGNYKIEEVGRKEGDPRYFYMDEEGEKVYVDGPLRFKAVPFILELPIFNGLGEKLNEIHLYPKNIENVPRIKKEVIGDSDRNIGEDIEWMITTTLPSQSSYENLIIYDLPSKGIDIYGITDIVIEQMPDLKVKEVNSTEAYDYELIDRKMAENELLALNDSVKIKNIMPEDEDRLELPEWYLSEDYIPTIKGIEFSEEGLKKINKFLSEKTEDLIITFKVTGKINGRDLEPYGYKKGEDEFQIPNMAVVDYEQAINLDESIVRTGGRQFVKQNVLGAKLEGAEFLVLNGSQKEYLKIDIAEVKGKDTEKTEEGEYYVKSYTWVSDAKEASVFRSNKEGILELDVDKKDKDGEEFDLKGLSNGRYYLEEIKAPEGYAKLTNYKEFQVTATSYYKENLDPMEIINTKLTIPETGGIGSLIFISVGLIVVTIGVQAKRKREELA